MDDHVQALIQQIRNPDPTLQAQSAIELGKLDISSHRQEALTVLRDLLGHSRLEVREAAQQALLQIGGKDTVKMLITCLTSTSTTVINYAIEILSKIGRVGIDEILDLLNSKDHDIRKFGCDILGNLHFTDSVYDLIELLNDPHINVTIAAGEALGKLGNPEAVPHLIRALHHPDTWMKCIAAEALGKIGDTRAVDALLAIPLEEEPIVLYTIIKAMGNLQDPRSVPYLLTILRMNSMFAPAVVQAIENLGARGGDAVYEQVKAAGVSASLLHVLSSDHPDVLRSAIQLVKKIHLPEAISPLQRLLQHADAEIVIAAITALVQIGTPEVTIPILQEFLTQTAHPAHKQYVRHALETLQQTRGAQ